MYCRLAPRKSALVPTTPARLEYARFAPWRLSPESRVSHHRQRRGAGDRYTRDSGRDCQRERARGAGRREVGILHGRPLEVCVLGVSAREVGVLEVALRRGSRPGGWRPGGSHSGGRRFAGCSPRGCTARGSLPGGSAQRCSGPGQLDVAADGGRLEREGRRGSDVEGGREADRSDTARQPGEREGDGGEPDRRRAWCEDEAPCRCLAGPLE